MFDLFDLREVQRALRVFETRDHLPLSESRGELRLESTNMSIFADRHFDAYGARAIGGAGLESATTFGVPTLDGAGEGFVGETLRADGGRRLLRCDLPLALGDRGRLRWKLDGIEHRRLSHGDREWLRVRSNPGSRDGRQDERHESERDLSPCNASIHRRED